MAAACLISCKDRKHEVPEEAVQADTVLTEHAWTPVDPMELNMNPVSDFAQDWMALAMGNIVTIAVFDKEKDMLRFIADMDAQQEKGTEETI